MTIVIEQSVEDVAESMKDNPTEWAQMFLEIKAVNEDLITQVQKLTLANTKLAGTIN